MISRYWAMELRYKLLRGVFTSYTLFCYTSANHPCGTSYWDKVFFSLNACAADQFYITSLVWTRDIFSVKHITHVAIAKTYTSMKARDVKNEKQMKLRE